MNGSQSRFEAFLGFETYVKAKPHRSSVAVVDRAASCMTVCQKAFMKRGANIP